MASAPTGFVPPPYPYDRLDGLRAVAAERFGEAIDLSIGTPMDPTPVEIVTALTSAPVNGYPRSIGSDTFRDAAHGWIRRRLLVDAGDAPLAACIGTKKPLPASRTGSGYDGLISTRCCIPRPRIRAMRWAQSWRVVAPSRSPSTIGGRYASMRSPTPTPNVRCAFGSTRRAIPQAVSTTSTRPAAWGRAHGVPVFSDECYAEFTWDGPARTILASGTDGVVAVHSLSKRSNLAGARIGFYVGDADLVGYLAEVRVHAGFMPAAPTQAAAAVALADDVHVDAQRERYRRRLEAMIDALAHAGIEAQMPRGGFYLWVRAPDGDGWGLASMLAERAGAVVSAGEFYGASGSGHVRIAVVAPDAAYATIAERLGTLS